MLLSLSGAKRTPEDRSQQVSCEGARACTPKNPTFEQASPTKRRITEELFLQQLNDTSYSTTTSNSK